MKNLKGYDKMIEIRKSNIYTSKWVFTITYADKINGEKVWRNYPNYLSETFKTKTEAKEALNNKLMFDKTLYNGK